MKKRILSLLLAVITILQMFPVFALPTIAEDDIEELSVDDMEVGKLYRAEFISDVFVPNGRYPFIDSGILDRSQLPRELTVTRKSADDYDLVYVTEDTANWPSEYTEYRYVTANKLSIAGGISIDSMEIGQIYTASWNTTDTGVYLYKKIPASESDIFVEYGYNSDQYVDPVVSTDGCPTELIVCLEKENDPYVRVTNEDWPEKYAQYRYLDPEYDIVILGEYVAPPADDGLVYGQVGLVMDGESVETLAIAKGEKTYVFTELGNAIEGTPTYRWQMLLDRESNSWANIQDYVYPYAPISEALLANAGLEDGTATLRCIATRDGINYASGELDITVDPTLPDPEPPLIPEPETEADPESRNTAVTAGSKTGNDGNTRAVEAFHIVVDYVYWNNSELAKDLHGHSASETFTVTLVPGLAYDGKKEHPIIPGYKAYVRDDVAGTREYAALEDPGDSSTLETHYYSEAEPIIFSQQKEGREITIYYLPVQVSITVNHYFQNLENDEYSLHDTVHLDGLADHPLHDSSVFDTLDDDTEDLYLKVEGFTGLYYDQGMRISSNGDTVVEIYYDRNYYLVNFDLTVPDGSKGYGVMPLYVRYDTQLLLGTPTAPGYTFNSWTMTSVYTSTEGIDTDGSIKVNKEEVNDASIRSRYANGAAMLTIKHNLEYKANWTVATAAYTVIYWRENVDSTDASNRNNYSVWATETVTGATPGATLDCTGIVIPQNLAMVEVDGDEEDESPYFTRANAMSDQSVVIKGDNSTVVNIYYTRNTYHIWFSGINGTCALYEHNHNDGQCDSQMFCVIEEHTHDSNCVRSVSCTIPEHTSHTAGCITCGKEEMVHTHNKSCYPNVGTAVNNPNGAPWWPSEGQIYVRQNGNKYIYINNQWYNYTGNVASGQIQQPTCGKETHAHTNSCYKDSLHTHIESCYSYSCGKTAHTHNKTDCYSPCTKYEHSHSEHGATASTSRYVWAISAKYGADISTEWPTAQLIKEKINSGYTLRRWSVEGINSNLVSKRVTMTPDLCDTSDNKKTATSESTSSTTVTYLYYMFESFDQTSPASGNDRILRGGKYYDSDSRYYQEVYGQTSTLSQKQISGMAPVSNGVTSSNNRQFLYYNRNRNDIIFENLGTKMYTMSDVMFEQPLNAAFFNGRMASYTGKKAEWEFTDANGNKVKVMIPIPDTPSSYEEGSVIFAGWYTTPLCVDGTEYNFANGFMPDAEVTLFAKWEPTYWDVTVYQEDPDEHADAKKLVEHLDIPFGTILSAAREPKRTPPMTGYIFAGWYYKEGTEEKRFDFNTMPVKKHYVIYAKWTSEIPVSYIVYYRTTTAGGEVIDIADPTEGVALAGKPRFFEAKVEKDLYEQYQLGYFPEFREQTVKIEPVESDPGEEKPFEIVFMYHHDTKVPYRITHVFLSDKFTSTFIGTNTLTVSWEELVTDAESALLTANFRDLVKPEKIKEQMKWSDAQISTAWAIIKDLSPDAYTKRLVLETTDNPADNEIVFYWSGRYDMTVYEVHHLYENLTYTGEADKYEKYETRTIQVFDAWYDKDNPGSASYEIAEVKGFQYEGFTTNYGDNSLTLVQPSATEDGLIIEVYYKRETYAYTLMYFDDATNMPIKDATTTSGRFEAQIKIGETAPAITGYNLSNGDEVVELRNNGQQIICYYTRRSAKYVYHQIGEGGSLYRYEEDILFNASDEDMAKTGSYAILADGYIFKKWEYKNSDGFLVEVPEDLAIVQNGVLKPQRVEEKDVGQTYEFYATIVPNTLTIKGLFSGTFNPHPYLQNQGFIYHINGKEGTDTAGYSITVALPIGESKSILGLPAGDYTITVEHAWSWRYSNMTNGCTVSENKDPGSWDSGTQTLSFRFDGYATAEFHFEIPANDPGKNFGGYFITDEVHN